MTAMPEILTERLLLRPPIASDFEGFAKFAADPIVTRFLIWTNPSRMIGVLSFLAAPGLSS